MIARVALLVGIVLGTAGAQYSCSSDGNGLITNRDLGSGNGPTFSATLILRDSAGAETNRFAHLELIEMELTVRNRSAEVVTVQMPSTVDSDFVVFTAGGDTPRWWSNEDQALPMVITQIVFQPNESKMFVLSWNQELRDGSFLTAGSYEARGMLRNVGFPRQWLAPHELGSNLRVFTID
jgi:hypothetical protein